MITDNTYCRARCRCRRRCRISAPPWQNNMKCCFHNFWTRGVWEFTFLVFFEDQVFPVIRGWGMVFPVMWGWGMVFPVMWGWGWGCDVGLGDGIPCDVGLGDGIPRDVGLGDGIWGCSVLCAATCCHISLDAARPLG